jgi:tetracycline repressor-like protein
VYGVLDSYTYGFALQEKQPLRKPPRSRQEMARITVGDMGGLCPYLAEVVVEFANDGYDYSAEFTFGLDLILDGIERPEREGST